MFINKITLCDVRGFRTLEFDLARPDGSYAGWTVFTGDNGSGKSTLLKAVALALAGPDIARALQPGGYNHWIREGSHEGVVELDVVKDPSYDVYVASGKTPAENRFPARITLTNGGRETKLAASVPNGKPKTYKTPERSIWAGDAGGWFSCGYGPFRRVAGASSDAVRRMAGHTTGRFITLFEEAASLMEVDLWLRDLNHKSLESKKDEASQLELLLKILGDELMPNQIAVDRVDSDGLWLTDRNGARLGWTEMSDGYRAAIALLSDILRHLIHTYGMNGLIGTDGDGRLFIDRPGVVLIDEVDAHLHPEWQREIGFWLKRHFPRIQFLVTTHSPIICQAADQNGLFHLPEPGSPSEPGPLSDEEYQLVISSRPDTILLSRAFGLTNTRSPRAVKGRQEYSRLASKRRAGADLSTAEEDRLVQLEMFVSADEAP